MTSVIEQATNESSSSETKPETGDLLGALVGDGKKFKTVEDLAKSKKESDDFIEQLKRENAQLREATKTLEGKADTQATLSEILAALKEGKTAEGGNQSPVTVDDLTKLVKSVTSQERLQELRNNNRELVDKTLVAKYGDPDKAVKVVKEKAKELGLGPNQLRELSESSPAAFLQLFGATKAPDATPTVKANINSEALNLMPSDGDRKYGFYKALRQKMGVAKFYGDFELQKQMQRDMAKYGAGFNDV